MNRRTSPDSRSTPTGAQTGKVDDQGALEKLAQTIDPSGREVSDAELIDPGANIPGTQAGKGNAAHPSRVVDKS